MALNREAIKAKKEQLGLSIKGLSDSSGLDVPYIKKLLYGNVSTPRDEALGKLAQALGCKKEEFFTDVDTDLMRKCTEILESTLKAYNVSITKEQFADEMQKLYDYALIRKKKKQTPHLDHTFLKWFFQDRFRIQLTTET